MSKPRRNNNQAALFIWGPPLDGDDVLRTRFQRSTSFPPSPPFDAKLPKAKSSIRSIETLFFYFSDPKLVNVAPRRPLLLHLFFFFFMLFRAFEQSRFPPPSSFLMHSQFHFFPKQLKSPLPTPISRKKIGGELLACS